MTFIEKIKRYLPSDKSKWKAFTFTSIPVIFSSLIFALNSFIDNFMSINIPGGNQSLAYANGWTEIQLGIISATTIIGTALFSQYVGKQDWKKVNEVVNIRMIFAVGICLIFALPCMIAPDFMIKVISGFDNKISNNIRTQAENYLRLITIAWLLNSWGFTLIMILRERDHGVISLVSSVLTLFLNICLNSIFIFVLKLGIEFLAYSTIISLSIDVVFLMIWIWIKDKKIFINILKIYQISPHITKQFFKRIWSFILFAVGSITVNIRFIQWSNGYGTGSIGKEFFLLSSSTVLGITGMFFNIFWTTFESFSATVAVYVGRELGNNDIEKAKKNAKELQGYHFIIGLIISSIAICFSLCIEYFDFLSDGYKKEIKNYYSDSSHVLPEGWTIENIMKEGSKTFLKSVKFSLLGISIFIPIFVWFVSRDRIISVGGLTNIVASIEAFFGLIQTAWLFFICFSFTKLKIPFSLAYTIFFISDIPKLIIYEVVYYKVNWARNITHTSTID